MTNRKSHTLFQLAPRLSVTKL